MGLDYYYFFMTPSLVVVKKCLACNGCEFNFQMEFLRLVRTGCIGYIVMLRHLQGLEIR